MKRRIIVLVTVMALMVAMMAPSALAAHPYWYTHNDATGQQSWYRYRNACTTFVSNNPGWTTCTKVAYPG